MALSRKVDFDLFLAEYLFNCKYWANTASCQTKIETFKRPNDSMSRCIRYGYVVEIKHVNFCFCAWLHEQGRRRSAKQQKPNVPLYRAHFGEIFFEEAFTFLCPLRWPIKFRYCEKTKKLVTSKQRFFQFFLTFCEYPNFLLRFLLESFYDVKYWNVNYYIKCLSENCCF